MVRSDLFGSFLVHWKLDRWTDHLVDGPDNLEHLIVGDGPVVVDIVHLEDPWKIKESKGAPVSGEEALRVTTTATIVRWLRTHRETQWERGVRTFELFIRIASRGEGERADELPKVDFIVVVSIKDIEEVFCELGWVTGGEDPLVEVSEFLLAEPAIRIVSHVILVPGCASIGGSGQGETYDYKDRIGLDWRGILARS